MEEAYCCVKAMHGRGHNYDCRHHMPRPGLLSRAWTALEEARKWWRQRGLHDDTDPACVYAWDNTTGGHCKVCWGETDKT